jgi:hypothetical protein
MDGWRTFLVDDAAFQATFTGRRHRGLFAANGMTRV